MVRAATTRAWLVAGLAAVLAAACGSQSPEPATDATPVYNQQTGRLEEIRSDRDGDGRVDTRAYMDGTRLLRIEIDRDGDGETDRWEHYAEQRPGQQAPPIERAEEAGGPERRIVRREFYVDGTIERVEEDTDLDGGIDKWETYRGGRLVHVDLDLARQGRPTRRLVYNAEGGVDRIEADADGDGVFAPITTPRQR